MAKKAGLYLFGAFMIFAAFGHLFSPELYNGMMPSFIPEHISHILAFVVELAIGIGLFIPKLRSLAGLGFMILMLIFLPVHIWDATKEQPAIGSTTVAYVRIVVQLALIYLGFRIFKSHKASS